MRIAPPDGVAEAGSDGREKMAGGAEGGRMRGMDEKLAEAKPVEPLPKKRRWFQFHLSTAVCFMLLAGIFMYLNWFPYTAKENTAAKMETGLWSEFGAMVHFGEVSTRGWPYGFTIEYGNHIQTYISFLLYNITICCGLLLAFSILRELQIRRGIFLGLSTPTYLVIALVLSAYVVTNLYSNLYPFEVGDNERQVTCNHIGWGWPMTAALYTDYSATKALEMSDDMRFYYRNSMEYWTPEIVMDAIIGGCMAAGSAFLCEYIILRRREGRKP
jgi:hypothetical protein